MKTVYPHILNKQFKIQKRLQNMIDIKKARRYNNQDKFPTLNLKAYNKSAYLSRSDCKLKILHI